MSVLGTRGAPEWVDYWRRMGACSLREVIAGRRDDSLHRQSAGAPECSQPLWSTLPDDVLDLSMAELGERWTPLAYVWLALVDRDLVGAGAAPWLSWMLGVYPLRGATLDGVDLRNLILGGADLRGAALRGVDLRGADMDGVDLRGATLYNADLRGVDLRKVDLRGARLCDADLRDSILHGVDLTGADLDGALRRFAAPAGWHVVGGGPWREHLVRDVLGGA